MERVGHASASTKQDENVISWLQMEYVSNNVRFLLGWGATFYFRPATQPRRGNGMAKWGWKSVPETRSLDGISRKSASFGYWP